MGRRGEAEEGGMERMPKHSRMAWQYIQTSIMVSLTYQILSRPNLAYSMDDKY